MQVFFSYAARDESFARQLREHLVRFGVDVWDPRSELMPGSNWLLESGNALERADAVIFLFSKEAAQSPWSRKEVEYVITQPRFEGKLVSVLLEPNLDIPWILHNLPVVNAMNQSPAAVAREVVHKLGAKPHETRRSTSARKIRGTDVRR